MAKEKSNLKDDAGFYGPYSHYNNLLRTWLVAYGIGGPAVLVTNKDLFQSVASKGHLAQIGWLFLGGVASQVLIAFINKISMWYLNYADENPTFKDTSRYKISFAVSEVFWPDILADITSIGCIGYATFLLFRTLA